jgi:hypothetical protein
MLKYVGGSSTSSRVTPGSSSAPASSCCTKFAECATLGGFTLLLPSLLRDVGVAREFGPLASRVFSDAPRSCRRSGPAVDNTPGTDPGAADLMSVDRRLDLVPSSGMTKGSRCPGWIIGGREGPGGIPDSLPSPARSTLHVCPSARPFLATRFRLTHKGQNRRLAMMARPTTPPMPPPTMARVLGPPLPPLHQGHARDCSN